jgi:carboxyl-terminal processing protease
MVFSQGRLTLRSGPFFRRGLTFSAALLLCAVWLLTPALADQARVKQLRKQAEAFEREHDWDKACDAYEALLRLDRTLPGIRERYRNALRRYYQVRRHRDATYLKDVLTLKYKQAVRLYEIVLFNLLEGSLDKQKLEPGRLFRKGLEEFSNALADPTFCQIHLRGLRPQDTREFRNYLRRNWDSSAVVLTREQAIEQVREVAMKALAALKLNATTVVMEFTCGSCYAIDDYTVYLTPSQFRELADLLKGEYVGVGVRLAAVDGKLVIDEIFMGSPAFAERDRDGMPKLAVGDLVLSIDKKPVANLPPEVAQKLLEGDVGSTVELVVAGSMSMAPRREVSLTRRPFAIPSVHFQMQSGAVGYVRISCFQETTVNDLDSALAELTKQGMKALILDLRGNSGGLFEVAVETARRFLVGGVIVRTRHQDPSLNTVYHARNPGALTVPLVVLVDGETASAAEVVAGALKDNKRARVVGQTTYGKGCSQGLLRLPAQGLLKLPPKPGGSATGGIRITVARFFSPADQPYSGRGVVPHVPVDPDPEQELVRALDEAQRMLGMVQ